MPATQRMKVANAKNDQKITKGGAQKDKPAKSPVGPYLLALFVFVVVGSAVFQLLQSVQMGGAN